jgi:hypothetical protein
MDFLAGGANPRSASGSSALLSNMTVGKIWYWLMICVLCVYMSVFLSELMQFSSRPPPKHVARTGAQHDLQRGQVILFNAIAGLDRKIDRLHRRLDRHHHASKRTRPAAFDDGHEDRNYTDYEYDDYYDYQDARHSWNDGYEDHGDDRDIEEESRRGRKASRRDRRM